MKKLISIVIIIVMFLMTCTNMVYAENGRVTTKILSDDFIEEFKPGQEGDGGRLS